MTTLCRWIRHPGPWLCGWLIGCVLAAPAFGASVNVPLDHWSYRAIDTLIGFGLIHTAVAGTKPFTRVEMARLIVEATQRVGGLPPHQGVVANDLLQRLRQAFQDEVRFRAGEVAAAPATLLKPLDEIAAQYVHLDGVPIRMLPTGGIDATEGTPLVRNNEGINYRDGENFLLTTTTYGKLWDWFAFFVQPLFTLKGDLDDDLDATVRLHKGYAKGQLGPVELEFGRDAIRWGQGERGTQVLSNHAPPLDFVKVSTPQPVLLPWIFQYLGLFKAETFLTQLEDDRDVPRSKIWGWRLQSKPTRWLEIGVLEATQFDGEGIPGLDFEDVLKILTFQRIGEEGEENKANQFLAFDWRITLPFLRFTQLYTEIGFEDRGDIGVLAGLYVPRLTDDGRTTFRFEWMQNTIHIDRIEGVLYTHSTFTSGFTFKGMVLGHADGGESQAFFWRLTRDFTERATLGLDFAYRWRQGRLLVGSTTEERHYEGGLDLQYFFTASWEVRARFAMEKVQNFNLQPDADRDNTLLWLQVKYHFL